MQAISLLAIQLIELVAALCLLQTTMKPQFNLMGIFKVDKLPVDRNPWLGSALGFSSLVLLVFLLSFLADSFMGPKVGNESLDTFFSIFRSIPVELCWTYTITVFKYLLLFVSSPDKYFIKICLWLCLTCVFTLIMFSCHWILKSILSKL